MAAIEFSRWFLALFFSVVAGFYTITIIVRKKRLGRSPVISGKPGSMHWFIHNTFRIFRAAIFVVCFARLADPGFDAWLLPLQPLWRPEVMVGGNALLALSFASIVLLHEGMGSDWRSGIDPEGPVRLITTGALAVTRNPMFLCIQAAQLGLFLSMPSVFTLICLLAGFAAVQAQVRLEERHLLGRFGNAYREYQRRVPRWLFRFRADNGAARPIRSERP